MFHGQKRESFRDNVKVGMGEAIVKDLGIKTEDYNRAKRAGRCAVFRAKNVERPEISQRPCCLANEFQLIRAHVNVVLLTYLLVG